MNERIKELDAQAVEYVLGVCDANGLYQGKEYLQVVKEKFAELIVKECADHIDDLVTCDDDGNQMLDCDDVRTELLEHFGVEQ